MPFDRTVKNKTFIDCDIIGPANIVFSATKQGGAAISGVNLINCAGVCTKNEIFVPEGIHFVDCQILRECIYGVLLFVPESGDDFMKKQMPGLKWVTPEPIVPAIEVPPTPVPPSMPKEK
jgi:hypothetical protein